jgi:two-component system phosphate regulon sensor histidine kinase PhoR
MQPIRFDRPIPLISLPDYARRGGEVDGGFAATLLAMAAHDLRQPLQVITGAHDLLARILSSDDQREELARAEDATAQLATMLAQLAEALRLQEGLGHHLPVAVPLKPVLEVLAAEFEESARLKGITFLVAAPRGAVLSHPALLTGMLRNLIRNAIDYTPSGGGVFVTARRCGAALRIAVRDTGVGIRGNALSMVFDAFRRLDQSRSDGLGLGLFIVKRAAHLLGHRIEVRSDEGRGSCFTIVANAATQQRRPPACDLKIGPAFREDRLAPRGQTYLRAITPEVRS